MDRDRIYRLGADVDDQLLVRLDGLIAAPSEPPPSGEDDDDAPSTKPMRPMEDT